MIKTAFFPVSKSNPYQELLTEALISFEVEVVSTPGVMYPTLNWLWNNRGQINVIHLHWLHQRYNRLSFGQTFQQFVNFTAQLLIAKFLGYKLIWTMHNTYPHQRLYPRVDRWVRLVVTRLSDAIIVHCNRGIVDLKSQFNRKKSVYVTPLGNYVTSVPKFDSKQLACARIGSENSNMIFLYFGSIKPYKGVPRLIQAFSKLKDEKSELFIVGNLAQGMKFSPEITEIVKKDSRVKLRLGWINDKDLAIYHAAADVAVFPFTNILTSSSVMLAISLGRPVIVPNIGCIPEMLNQSCAIFFDPGSTDSLYEALCRSWEYDLDKMGRNAFELSLSMSWKEHARILNEVYCQLI